MHTYLLLVVPYDIDEDESKHALALEEHGHEEKPNAWVLLDVDKTGTERKRVLGCLHRGREVGKGEAGVLKLCVKCEA